MDSRSLAFRLFLVIEVSCTILVHEATASASTALVGLWRFNEGAGTNVTDSSGFNNNGVLAGESGNLPAWGDGKPEHHPQGQKPPKTTCHRVERHGERRKSFHFNWLRKEVMVAQGFGRAEMPFTFRSGF